MDIEQARVNMIKQQLKTWDVHEQRLLDVYAEIPREQFLKAEYRELAYADTSLPIGHEQKAMPPKEQARLLQALNIKPDDVVLEVGTGCGFVTALLARLAKHVYSVDMIADFTQAAKQNLSALGLDNVTLITGDACQGWPEYAPYDVIFISGAIPSVSAELKAQLKAQGRIAAIVGQAPAMQAVVNEQVLFETEVMPLKQSQEIDNFSF